jgi:hypothetical protein
MHLAPPNLTTTGKSKTKKLTPAQIKAKAEHDAWLKKQNLHPTQLAKNKRKEDSKLLDLRQRTPVILSNSFAPGGFKIGIMENLRHEAPHVQAEILAKAAACAPAFSKGGIQYLGTSKEAWRDAGKKNSQ